jgi:tRNA(fMet)-specific endonuclease VapC
MPGRYLLDTNAVIALFANDPSMIDRLQSAEEVFVPSIALGELYYGARRSHRVDENIARIGAFTSASSVLDCDHVTARVYGEIKDHLRRIGRPIPENDLWIAAVASQYDLILVTRDVHFAGLPAIVTESW